MSIHTDRYKNLPGFAEAVKKDSEEPLSVYRQLFSFPHEKSHPVLYFTGHSLGLKPHRASNYIQQELEDWAKYGVDGHFKTNHPWVSYHELVTEPLARLVGAKPTEVVAMNTLTVNLHLLLVSFYRPSQTRYKILIEDHAFPSDQYAVDSQARFHGFKTSDAIVEMKASDNQDSINEDDLIKKIQELGSELSLVLIGQCNYLSGQKFNLKKITDEAHKVGAIVGANLAHGAGNLNLSLHDDNLDFAVWCSYKYLNSGPGAIAGAYIHERHHSLLSEAKQKQIPRFEGWWGHQKDIRFKMDRTFCPIPSAEAWQLSNPPIFQLAALRASLELFDSAGMNKLYRHGQNLTAYFSMLLSNELGDEISVVTKPKQGSMLCLKVRERHHEFKDYLSKQQAIVDFREPNIIRATPVPLYNNYQDIFELVHVMKGFYS